jgi:hypothetical protein
MQTHAILENKGFATSRMRFEQLVDELSADESMQMTHAELEVLIQKDGTEVLRQLLQEHLELRAQSRAARPMVGSDDRERTHVRERARRLVTIFGPVTVSRLAYGARDMESLFPLDAQLNLPMETYSFGLRRKVAREAAKSSFSEVVEAVSEGTGVQVPKRQVEELVRRAAVDFDEFYESRKPAANERTGPVLVMTTDGKGVVMRQEDLRESTRKAAEQSQPKLTKRRSKGEKPHRKRMAQVASVYTTKRFVRTPQDIVGELSSVGKRMRPKRRRKRPKPEHKRVWASVAKEPAQVIGEMFAEAHRRDPPKRKQWVTLVDGSEPQLDAVLERAEQAGVEVTVILDLIHVLEYLWKASHAFFGEASTEGEQWVTKRLLHVLEGRCIDVAAGIRRSATLRGLTSRRRELADKCADYLLNYAEYMRYDEYLADGLPIATGVIEGACRYLVKDRMDITGARWSLDGAEAVLRLRALRASGDFEAYWGFHESQELQRNHASRYAHGIPPLIRESARSQPPLRLVA